MFANFLQIQGGKWNTVKINPELVAWEKIKVFEDGFTTTKANLISLKSTSILETITLQRTKDIQTAILTPGKLMSDLESQYRHGNHPDPINLFDHLNTSPNLHLLAEIKRASPSKGDINTKVDANSQALSYFKAGASVISVLSEPKWFKGSLNDIRSISSAFQTTKNRPAILQKDFITEVYQILEARLSGADSILLIMAILNDNQATELLEYSRILGMEPLVEAANEEEVKRAISIGAKIIGINNRDLHTFQVDSKTSSVLSLLIPKEIIVIALSGISWFLNSIINLYLVVKMW